jgi:hypothetical protein
LHDVADRERKKENETISDADWREIADFEMRCSKIRSAASPSVCACAEQYGLGVDQDDVKVMDGTKPDRSLSGQS